MFRRAVLQPILFNRVQVPSFSRAMSSEKRLKIYTRTGDKGTSSLYTGERRPKDDMIFEVLGTTDELSSHLGLAREYCEQSSNGLSAKLEKIQCILQDIGSHVATPRTSTNTFRLSRTEFDSEGSLTTELEEWIDALDDGLPPLKTFILPSGGLASSSLHVCRSVCRRAERSISPLVRDGLADESAGRYVNRLSDFLFTAARVAAKADGKAETIYRKQEGVKTNN